MDVITLSLLVFIIGCTENPFFKDKPITGNRLSGTVKLLSVSDSYHHIYVWLEGYNIGIYADENGFFSLDITSFSQLGVDHSGNYKIYFYTNNYYLDSAKVVIVNNKIQYGQGDLNDEGELKNTVYLSELLDIDVIMENEIVQTDSIDTIKFQILLDAIKDTVYIKTQTTGPLNLTAAILKKIDTPEKDVLINNGGSIYQGLPIFPEYKIPDYQLTYNMIVKYDPNILPPGEYQFIPYIIVSYPKLPSQLVKSIGMDSDELDTDFLNIPIAIDGGRFSIVAN